MQSVRALLDDLRLVDPQQYALVEAVRQLVKQTIANVSEEVKYGGIVFSSGMMFGGVFAYKQHVSVEFSNGARIADQLGHLQGSGKFRRHLKLYSEKDIEQKALAEYLPLALKAAQNT